MGGGGRERRRRSPINILRRWLYGIFVTTWSLHGHAASASDDADPARRVRHARDAVEWEFSDALFLGGQPPQGHDDFAAAAALQPAVMRLRDRAARRAGAPPLLAARFDVDAADMIRSGVAVDLSFAGVAQLHLTLSPGADERASGRRWALVPGEPSARRNSRRACSLGGSLEFIRVWPYGDRRLVAVPQLNLELGAIFGALPGMQASIRYAHWNTGQEKGTVGDALPQLVLRWSF